MRYISMDNLEPGMVVAKNVLFETNSGGKIVGVRANATLSENVISSLYKRGIMGLYIEDELSNGVVINDYLSDEVKSVALKALKNKNINEIIAAAKEIVKSIYGNKKMDFDFNSIINSVTEEEHALNVCELSLSLANQFGFKYEELLNMATTALLHNIAKIIPRKELEKELRFQGINYEEAKMNFLFPYYGYYYLKGNTNLNSSTKQAILFGSVNENGTGFPFKLVGKEKDVLKKYSKILLICDTYEKYLKYLKNPLDAKKLLNRDLYRGIVDPTFAETFVEKISVYPVGSLVELSNGDVAIVIRNCDTNPERPLIRTEYGSEIDLMITKGIGIVGYHTIANEKTKAVAK